MALKKIGIVAVLGTALATSSLSLGAGTAAAVGQCGTANGWGVSVGGAASCGFAMNVANNVSWPGPISAATVTAYSPATGMNYSVSCSRLYQKTIKCDAGIGATVYLNDTRTYANAG